MPAVSKSQQSLFSLAKAVKAGEVSGTKVGTAVKKIAKTMSKKEIDKFAKTKTKDLPKKKEAPKETKKEATKETKKEVKKENVDKFRSIIREFIKRSLTEGPRGKGGSLSDVLDEFDQALNNAYGFILDNGSAQDIVKANKAFKQIRAAIVILRELEGKL